MAQDWIHRANAAFRGQAMAFANRIAADPAVYYIDPSESAQLSAEFAAFDAAYFAAADAAYRTSAGVTIRNTARTTLAAHMRNIAARVRADLSISEGDKINLSLTAPGGASEALGSPPQTRPYVSIRSVVNNLISVRLRDPAQPSRSGKPRSVTGAKVFCCVSNEPSAPQDLHEWRSPTVTLSSKATIRLPWLAPGTKVWIAAQWFNGRGETGAVSDPVYTYVGGMMITPSLAA